MSSVLSQLVRLLIARIGLLVVSGDRRDGEILALRHQIQVLQRQIEQGPIDVGERGLVVLASKHRELVAQHDGLEVLGATGTYSEAGQGGDEDDR